MKWLVLLLSLGLGMSAQSASMRGMDIGDGSLYRQPERVDAVTISGVPVSLAEQFIQKHWLQNGMWLENDVSEVDVLPMAEDAKRSLLEVNKGTRRQQVSLGAIPCPLAGASLSYLCTDNRARDAPFSGRNGRVSFDLPGETLNAVSWSAS